MMQSAGEIFDDEKILHVWLDLLKDEYSVNFQDQACAIEDSKRKIVHFPGFCVPTRSSNPFFINSDSVEKQQLFFSLSWKDVYDS